MAAARVEPREMGWPAAGSRISRSLLHRGLIPLVPKEWREIPAHTELQWEMTLLSELETSLSKHCNQPGPAATSRQLLAIK